ncbi:PA14 domain-containing protein, partial [candidate division KSB1 bacterium]
ILPDYGALTPVKTGIVSNFSFEARDREEYFSFLYEGFINIPKTGVYTFFTDSDDGSRLYIASRLIVDNDGLHGMNEESGAIALEMGFHPIKVTFFEKTGGDDLKVYYRGPDIEKQQIEDSVLIHKSNDE